jgi:hypothetical protein
MKAYLLSGTGGGGSTSGGSSRGGGCGNEEGLYTSARYSRTCVARTGKARLTTSSSGSDVGKESLDVLTLEGLGEESGPDGLKLDLGGGGEGDELVGSDLNTLVGKDKSGVGSGEFGLERGEERKGGG